VLSVIVTSISVRPPVSLPTTISLVEIFTLSANILDVSVNVLPVLIETLRLSSFAPTTSVLFATPLPSPTMLAASELSSVTVYPSVFSPFTVLQVTTCVLLPSSIVIEDGLVDTIGIRCVFW